MNKETINSHNGVVVLIFLLIIPFVVIFSDNEYAFGLVLLISVVLMLACSFVKEGYIATDSGVTFWKWWRIHTYFDYSSIHSVDVKVKLQCVGKSFVTVSPVYTMNIVTDRGKFTFKDTVHEFYSRKEAKDPDRINEIIENSDLMRLKRHIESKKQRYD